MLRSAGNGMGASLGYYLARPYWGRGLASEASRAFIETAFTQLGLDRVQADVENGHSAFERILQKFGFKYVRHEEIPGRGRLIDFYELTRTEWQRRRESWVKAGRG